MRTRSWSQEDDAYLARIPQFPNLSGFGETPEKALKEAQKAAEGMIEVIKEDGELNDLSGENPKKGS